MNTKLYILLLVCCFGRHIQASAETSVSFYGHIIKIHYQPPVFNIHTPLEKLQIQAATGLMDTRKVMDEIDELSYRMQLDDIAYLQLVKTIARKLYCDDFSQKIFTYNLLKNKGYDIILCFGSNHINLYGKSFTRFYNINSIVFQNQTYYDLFFDRTKQFIDEIIFEKPDVSARSFVINTNYPPRLNAINEKFNLHMEYDGMIYFFEGFYNKSLALYYKDLPDIEPGDIYINYGLSNVAAATLLPQLQKAIYGMTTIKALDFILKFTQQAFPYKNDLDKYGSEKFSFPEEMFLNINADCEDKSFMLAYLAKQLLDLKSVGLIYLKQNHLNVAVSFDIKSKIYNFVYDNQKYLVCEPSGVGLKPGENYHDLNSAYMLEW